MTPLSIKIEPFSEFPLFVFVSEVFVFVRSLCVCEKSLLLVSDLSVCVTINVHITVLSVLLLLFYYYCFIITVLL